MTTGVSPSSARRFERRRRSGRLLRMRPLLVLAGLVVLVGVGVWVVGFSSLLDTRTVAVQGVTTASGLTVAQVRAAAEVPLRRPLARLDLDAVRTRIVAQLPPVKDATVTRSWPHEVRVMVTERKGVAVWRDGATYRLLDAEGVAFRTLPGVERGLPVVQLPATPTSPARAEELRVAGATVSAALPKKLVVRLRTVQVATPDSISLRLADGVTVFWGSAEESKAKARVLDALLPRKATVYDVSVPTFPTTRA
ncbi:cell division protein FtsQ/DivIB [Actinopolymorpha pittospori]